MVEPHSMSIVPFCSSGIRFAEVTAWYCFCMSARPVTALTRSAIFSQIS